MRQLPTRQSLKPKNRPEHLQKIDRACRVHLHALNMLYRFDGANLLRFIVKPIKRDMHQVSDEKIYAGPVL